MTLIGRMVSVTFVISVVKKFSYKENTNSFDRLWDLVAEAGQPVVVSRRGAEPVIMMPLSEWRSVQETLHLFRSPANGLRLLSALQRVEAQSIRTKGCRAGGSRGRSPSRGG